MAKMKSRFNSMSELRCKIAEFSGLSFQEIVYKSNSDRRKPLQDLVAHIDAQIVPCFRDCRNESIEVEFLRNALLTADWLWQHLYSIEKSTNLRKLQSQLASDPQVHENVLAWSGSSSSNGPYTSTRLKPGIFSRRWSMQRE